MRCTFHRQAQLRAWAHEYALVPSVAVPEDWPERAGFRTRGLAPLYQGDHLVALSGAFAAVNAIRLLVRDHGSLSITEEAALLDAAWRWAKGRQTLQPGRGLRQGEFPRLIEGVCQWFGRTSGQFIGVSQPWRANYPGREEFFGVLERLIVSQHILVGLLVGAHYSVVRGYTPKSLLLFDSGGQCWIHRNAVDLHSGRQNARHRFAAASMLALRRGG